MKKHGLRLRILYTLTVLATTGLTSGSARGDYQLLSNPGFESGSLSPWVLGRNYQSPSDWTVTSSVSNSGTYSATVGGNEELLQNFTATATSSILSVTFYAEHNSATANSLSFDLFYSDGTDNEFLIDTTGTGFNFFDVTSYLLAGKSLSGFSVFGLKNATTYFDDASIIVAGTSVPEPSSMILMGIGLAGAVFRLRTRRGREAV